MFLLFCSLLFISPYSMLVKYNVLMNYLDKFIYAQKININKFVSYKIMYNNEYG